ncbi:hypothetical protein [Microcoleus sp. FACHB-672]|nr:hypothetical protein [Microcoleus sp. FACHB-672]
MRNFGNKLQPSQKLGGNPEVKAAGLALEKCQDKIEGNSER